MSTSAAQETSQVNLDVLHAATEGMTAEQRHAAHNHLIGWISRLIDPDEWARAVEHADAFARRVA